MAKKERVRQPMLAVEADLDSVRFPVLASPKLDGFRALTVLEGDGVKAKTRKFLPIPNDHVRKTMETLPPGLDGELIHPSLDFKLTSSLYRREYGEPDFVYYVFDWACTLEEDLHFNKTSGQRLAAGDFKMGFVSRLNCARNYFAEQAAKFPFVKVLEHEIVNNREELDAIVVRHLAEGYEGTMLRDPNGMYKFGRSTVNEGGLLKIKQWVDEEGEVIGFNERMHNGNTAEKNEFGRTKRSTHQENKTGLGTLGSFIVKRLSDGVIFNVPGRDAEFNQEVWDNREKYMGKIMTYESQKEGADNAPRFPCFKFWRPDWDMSEVVENA